MQKFNNSSIFQNPVDPDKLGIPDYFDIIKNPMDFATIKNRINSNYYHHLQEYLDDIALTFQNCILYNGESSTVGKMCKSVMEEFKKQYDALNMDFYLK